MEDQRHIPKLIDETSYEFFFKQFPEGVLCLDPLGTIVNMNSQAEILLGWDKDDLCATQMHEYLCPDDSEFQHDIEHCLFSPPLLKQQIEELENNLTSELQKIEQWWVKKDGIYIHVDIKLFIIKTESSDKQLILLFSDCSEQRFSEAETKRLSLFSELNPAPILQLDAETIIHYANPAMTDLMVEHGFSEFGLPNIIPANIQSIINQCLSSGKTILNIEHQYQQVWFNWNFHLIDEGDMQLVQCYGMDISASKKNQQYLLDLKELAEENNRQKSTFFASMSHELRTPLNGIIGMSGLMQETELSGIQHDYADKMSNSAQSLLMIINDVLDISKIEAGKLEIELTQFNIHELMYNTISVLEYQAAQKNLDLVLRIDPKIPDFLIGDALRIRQIIINFLTNAVKFTDRDGQVFLNICLKENEITAHKKQNITLLFAVEDSGIGIAQDRLEAVFQKYTQADKSTTRNYGGTGLGLSISKELASLMQGDVGLESSLGVGSSFYLSLPLKVKSKGPTFSLDPLLKHKKCLIVAENETQSRIIDEILKQWQINTIVEKDPQLALSMLSRRTGTSKTGLSKTGLSKTELADFDIVILCGICKIELLQQFALQQHFFSLAIIKSSSQQHINQMTEIGIQAYLFNPFLTLHLKQLLHHAIAQQQRQHPKSQEILSIHSLSPVPKDKLQRFSLRVLLVEDNLINQKIARAMIEKMGCQVDVANDGIDALNHWGENCYDVIFMDCHLPEMDGYQCTREIRKREKNTEQHIPIVALTANTADEERNQTQQAGMDDFLSKPIEKPLLKKLLETISLTVDREETL